MDGARVDSEFERPSHMARRGRIEVAMPAGCLFLTGFLAHHGETDARISCQTSIFARPSLRASGASPNAGAIRAFPDLPVREWRNHGADAQFSRISRIECPTRCLKTSAAMIVIYNGAQNRRALERSSGHEARVRSSGWKLVCRTKRDQSRIRVRLGWEGRLSACLRGLSPRLPRRDPKPCG